MVPPKLMRYAIVICYLVLSPFIVYGQVTIDVETGKITIEGAPTHKEPHQAPAPKPPPAEPKSGVGVGPHRSSSGGLEAGITPPSPKTTTLPISSAPASNEAAIYYAWSGLWIADAWRPVVNFVAGEIKSKAIEESAYLLADIAGHYGYGEAWAGSVEHVWARGALWSGFMLYAYLIADPTEIGLGPEPFEKGDKQRIKEIIDDLEKQKKIEMVPGTI